MGFSIGGQLVSLFQHLSSTNPLAPPVDGIDVLHGTLTPCESCEPVAEDVYADDVDPETGRMRVEKAPKGKLWRCVLVISEAHRAILTQVGTHQLVATHHLFIGTDTLLVADS